MNQASDSRNGQFQKRSQDLRSASSDPSVSVGGMGCQLERNPKIPLERRVIWNPFLFDAELPLITFKDENVSIAKKVSIWGTV